MTGVRLCTSLARTKGPAAYCGPTALSAITGRPPESFLGARGNGKLMSCEIDGYACQHFNVRVVYYPRRSRRPTLWQVCRAGRLALAITRDHVVVVQDFTIYDNNNRRRQWAPDYKGRKRRVVRLLVLTPRDAA